jgi:hypothetical protein
MILLHEFLNVMDLDSELEIFDNNTFDKLVKGCRNTLDIPFIFYDAEVTHFIPGIMTKIWVNLKD